MSEIKYNILQYKHHENINLFYRLYRLLYTKLLSLSSELNFIKCLLNVESVADMAINSNKTTTCFLSLN